MKNLFVLSVMTVLMLAVACGGVNKELLGKLQTDLTQLEGLAPAYEAMGVNINNLTTQLNAVPEGMKTETNPEYQNMLRLNNTMTQKYQATMAEQSDLTNKFRTLIGDYTAGKIKTEDALKEYETLSAGVKGMVELLDRMNKKIDNIQTEYAKMSANMNAAAEKAAGK